MTEALASTIPVSEMSNSRDGYKVDVSKVEALGDYDGTSVFRVEVFDPVLATMTPERAAVDAFIAEAITQIKDKGYVRSRKPLLSAERTATANPIADHVFGDPNSTLGRWRNQVPTARALYPLQNPDAEYLLDDASTPITNAERPFLTYCMDAIGIRSRGAVMSWLIQREIDNNPNQSNYWLSLASGAADPVFKTAGDVNNHSKELEIDLVDYDAKSLDYARQTARRHGFNGAVANYEQDLFKMDQVEQAIAGYRGETALERYDIVDILGFFEYLSDDDRRVFGNTIPSAATFLSQAYKFVKPGGMLIFGNMRDTHPQLDLTLKVVQWPFIQPRSVDETLTIIDRAGIDRRQAEVYLPDDDVYTLVALRKS